MPDVTKVKKHIGWRDKAWNCLFTWTDSKGVSQTAKGRKFIVDGVTVELFPTGALCSVLERNYRCLYKWEKEHGFPQAMWRVRDIAVVNRWYSRSQLAAIYVICKKFNWLQKKDRFKLPLLIKAVKAVFYVVDQPGEKT
jgi:hypothetical protein